MDSAGQTQARPLTGKPKSYGVQELQERYRQAKGAKSPFLPDFYLNMAFFAGYQWTRWLTGRLDRIDLHTDRETITDNRIMPVVSSRAARKVKNRPAFVATPFTAAENDIDAAKIAEKVLDADWINLGLQGKLFRAVLFAEICGAGFWKVYWDSTKGDSQDFVYDANSQPVMQNDRPLRADTFNGNLPEGLTSQPLSTGDVSVDVLSPFEFFPDPIATSLEECEWVIEEKVRSLEYVRRRYGIEATADADAPQGPVESRLFSSALYSEAAGDAYKGVRVFEFWAPPSTEFPKGKRCVWANDKILAEDDQPFDPMPYVMFSGVEVPNRFWPTAVTTQLRGPQVERNKLLSQVQENAKRIGNPALMRSRQANVFYSGKPGEEILYDSTVPDAVPSYLIPPEVPGYVREQMERIENSMSEISGMHELSRATVPAGVTAASAINLLQEADDTRLGPEIQDMETQLAVAGTKILKLRAQYNSDERLVRIAGEDGGWDIFSFRGEMLGENVNVEVQAGSAMPRSKAAKQAAMLEVLQVAAQYGLQFDPRDLRRFFKDYEVAALDRLFGNISEDETQTNAEQRIMAQGYAVPINEWDDDQFHIQAHNSYRKTQRFSRLTPQLQELVNVHVRAHQEREVQTTNLQVQAQAQAQALQATTPEGGLQNPAGAPT